MAQFTTSVPAPVSQRLKFASAWQPLACVAALLCFAPTVIAQVAPAQLPSAAEPRQPTPPPLLPPMRTSGSIAVPQSAATQAPPGAEQIQFTLTQFQIDGLSAVAAEGLKPLYTHLLGKTITVADAFAVAQAIELKYRSAGFVTSRVIVPVQTIADGVFRVQVIEGFVSDIRMNESIGPARAAVLRLLTPLLAMRPVTVGDIERQLLLANDLVGLTVSATLEPSPSDLGGSVMVVKAERRASDMSVSLDNRNSPYLGWAGTGASLAFNAFGESANRITLSGRASLPLKRSQQLAAGYDTLLSSQGLTLGIYLSAAKTRPGLELDELDVRSRVSSALATLTYPLLRSREQNLRLVGQFEARDVDTDIAATPFTRDRFRIARAGLSYDRSDAWDGISALRVTLHKGIEGLGASRPSPLASRAKGRSDFFKITADATRVQQMDSRSSALFNLTGQWASRALLASEEMALGGSSFGRAFDEGEIAADKGIAASVELRHNPEWSAFSRGAQVYAYADVGRLRATRDGAQLTKTQGLASLGFGLRASLSQQIFSTLEVAAPINTEVKTQGNRHPRVFLSFNVQL